MSTCSDEVNNGKREVADEETCGDQEQRVRDPRVSLPVVRHRRTPLPVALVAIPIAGTLLIGALSSFSTVFFVFETWRLGVVGRIEDKGREAQSEASQTEDNGRVTHDDDEERQVRQK